jgi:hypothetical protein
MLQMFPLLFTLMLAKGVCDTPPAPWWSGGKPALELKGGYFLFSTSKMRKIYSQGGWDVQLSGSSPVWKWLQVYGSIEYIERNGHASNGGGKTQIWQIPVSAGVRPVIPIYSWAQYYVTLGPRYFFVHTQNHSPYVDKHLSKNGLGGFVNTGFNFFPWRHFLVDVFGEYSYKRMHFHSSRHNVYGRTVQVGGFAFGLGLGYAF